VLVTPAAEPFAAAGFDASDAPASVAVSPSAVDVVSPAAFDWPGVEVARRSFLAQPDPL